MSTMIKPTVPFLLSTALTGICCHFSGMTRPDLIVAVIFAAIVSGTVAFGAHAVNLRQ